MCCAQGKSKQLPDFLCYKDTNSKTHSGPKFCISCVVSDQPTEGGNQIIVTLQSRKPRLRKVRPRKLMAKPGPELKFPGSQAQPRGPDAHNAFLQALSWCSRWSAWSCQGGHLCHLVHAVLLLRPRVEESLSLASCPSPSCPSAFPSCPPTALLAHRHTHTNSELQVSRATNHRGNHITFVDTGGREGYREGTRFVLSTCHSPHGHLAFRLEPRGLVAMPQPPSDLPIQFWPGGGCRFFSPILKSWVGVCPAAPRSHTTAPSPTTHPILARKLMQLPSPACAVQQRMVGMRDETTGLG